MKKLQSGANLAYLIRFCNFAMCTKRGLFTCVFHVYNVVTVITANVVTVITVHVVTVMLKGYITVLHFIS